MNPEYSIFRLPARKYRLYFLLLCGTGLYFFANLQRVAIPGTVFNLLQEIPCT